jgi:hypothetical protein
MAGARAEDHVAGMGEVMKQASAGLKLFKTEEAVETDLPAAEAFKTEMEAQIATLEAEAAALTGKDNKKERAAKGKQVSDLKANAQYIDACKVAKGLEPKNGFFVKNPKAAEAPPETKEAEAPAESVPDAKKEAKKKDAKPAKKQSAGISPAETAELEKLKNDIIERKTQLKADGMSGGQQNKDSQIVQWVTRMNELKEKADPGSTAKDAKKDDKKKSKAPLSADEQKEADGLRNEIELYKHKLKTEFGYSNKDMKIDPELLEMEAKMAAYEKRGA